MKLEKNHRKLQIPRGNNKPQEIYEKPNIRIKKKSRGGKGDDQ